MPSKQRLSRADFSEVASSRPNRVYGALFTLVVSRNKDKNAVNKPKFACVVSKKVAVRAVDRNRIRRLSREVARTLLSEAFSSLNLILYAKKEAKKASYQTIETDVKALLARIK